MIEAPWAGVNFFQVFSCVFFLSGYDQGIKSKLLETAIGILMNYLMTRRILLWSALSAAVILLAVGLSRTHPVFPRGISSINPSNAVSVSESQLVVDATFGGVTRQSSNLVSTYERADEQGKQPCPT